MACPLRRQSAVIAGLLFLAIGCGTVSRVQDSAARPPIPRATDSPAVPSAVLEATRGSAATVQLPDGARLSLPAGAIVSAVARLSIKQQGPGLYEARIDGDWQGRADVRLPVGTASAAGQSFMLAKQEKSWEVADAEQRPDGFLYASLPAVSTLRALNCDAKLPDSAKVVLGCLSGAGVSQVPDALARSLAAGLGCSSPWPETPLVSRAAYCIGAPLPSVASGANATGGGSGTGTTAAAAVAPQVTRPPAAPPATTSPSPAASASTTPAPAAPASNILQVRLTEDPVRCDGTRRSFGTVFGADAGEAIQFSSPGIDSLLPGRADSNGSVTVHWVCSAQHVGRTWSLTAVGESSGRSVTFALHGGAGA